MKIENKGKNSLFYNHPEIAKKWDYEKNYPLRPENVTSHCNKKYFWLCEKGHSYSQTVDKKVNGQKCPICSNKKVLSGYNDLQTKNQRDAKDWDYEKNYPLKPNQIIYTSSKKYYWVCNKCGHKWKSSVRDKTETITGCPKCGLKQRGINHTRIFIKKNGCLSDEKLLLDWDYEANYPKKPEDFTKSSNKMIYWKCHVCGYKWKAKLCNRTHGRGCPCCSNKVLVPGKNDLATTHQQLAKEWHPTKNGSLTPRDVTFGQRILVWWLCPKGHEYQASLNHRTNPQGTGCPHCFSQRQTSFAEQAFYFYIKKMYPEAINRYKAPGLGRFELDIYIPSRKLAIEYDGEAWHKEQKLEREKRKYLLCKNLGIKLLRIREGEYPSYKKEICDEMFCLKDMYKHKLLQPVINHILNYIKPFDLDDILNPRNDGLEKDYDINIKRDQYEIQEYIKKEIPNSIAIKRPELVKEWHPTKNGKLKPEFVPYKSSKKYWWLCPNGHEYQASAESRSVGTGCKQCYLNNKKS